MVDTSMQKIGQVLYYDFGWWRAAGGGNDGVVSFGSIQLMENT